MEKMGGGGEGHGSLSKAYEQSEYKKLLVSLANMFLIPVEAIKSSGRLLSLNIP
jgi:hypothetical protein